MSDHLDTIRSIRYGKQKAAVTLSSSPDTKVCPFCKKQILVKAIKCRYCKRFLDSSIVSDQETSQYNSEPNVSGCNVRRLNFIHLNNNAYRILGLPNTASQLEIYERESAIRRELKVGINKQTSWDLLWLGSFERSESTLRDAVRRLTNPFLRLQERFFWFSEGVELLGDGSLETLSTIKAEALRKGNSHDSALLELFHAHLLDGEIQRPDIWIGAINSWQKVLESEDIWSTLLDIDLNGEFEPFASIQDIENLKSNVYRHLYGNLLEAANIYKASHNDLSCARILRIFRGSSIPKEIAYQFEGEILNSLEDEVEKLSEEIREIINEGIDKENIDNPKNKETCNIALNNFEKDVIPIIERLKILAEDNEELLYRVFLESATCLRTIALGYTWADDFTLSKEQLEKAKSIAPIDSSVYQRLIEDLCDISESAEKEKVWKDLKSIKSAPALQTINGIGFTLYGSSDFDQQTNSYLATYYFVFFFIPIFPICRYRVIASGENSYRFLGKAPLTTGHKWHIGVSLLVIFIILLIASASSVSSSRYNHNSSSNYIVPNTRTVDTSSIKSPSSNLSSSLEEPFSQNSESQDYTPTGKGDLYNVNLNATYREELERQIEAGREKLKNIEPLYEQSIGELQAMESDLTYSKNKLDLLSIEAANGSNIDEYEMARENYNKLVERYNATLKDAQSMEEQYNTLIDEDHRLVQQYNAL